MSAERNKTIVDALDAMHKEAYRIARENKLPFANTYAANSLARLHGLYAEESDNADRLTINIDGIDALA